MKLKISALTAAVFAMLAAVILALYGCDDGAVSPDQSNQTNQMNQSNQSNQSNSSDADRLITDAMSPYAIVRPDSASADEIDAAIRLRQAILDATGVELELKTDFVREGSDEFKVGEYEILIGSTNRDESIAALGRLRSFDWTIERGGTKIVLYSEENIGGAVDYFIENYIHDGNIYIPDGEAYTYTADYKFDTFEIAGLPIGEYTLCYTDKGSYDACISLSDYLSESCGYRLDAVASTLAESPRIIIATDSSLDPTSATAVMRDGDVYILRGEFVGGDDSVNLFCEQIEALAKDKILTLDASFEIKETEMETKLILADEEFMSGLDARAEEMKAAVLNSESDYTVGDGGCIYYFAADGDDNNDGLSESTPKRTLGELARLDLKSGDVVLFRRGDLFRGSISAVVGVTYSAWGDGAKPIISASKRNYADESLWQPTEYDNVWVCTETLVNVGIVALDHTGELGKYDELVGIRKVAGVGGFTGAESLSTDLEVWSDLESNKLYMYSAENPGTRFESIEIGERGNAISIKGGGVTIDNLHVTLTGSHGVGAGTTVSLTVRNCVFNWLGGSILTGFAGGDVTGYGNAVEVYGSVDGYRVYNNWIYQIYDTGITHQFSQTPSVKTNIMRNVEYSGNLIEYCFWSIEYYNASGGEGTYRETRDIHIHDNFCRMGGYGWGCAGRESGAPMYCLGSPADKTENYVTENNIFDRCLGYLVSTYGFDPNGSYIFRNNTYVQPYGAKFARIAGKDYIFDSTAASILEEKLGETTPIIAAGYGGDAPAGGVKG